MKLCPNDKKPGKRRSMTTAPAVAPEDRVPIRTKIFYGAGTGAEQIALTSIETLIGLRFKPVDAARADG